MSEESRLGREQIETAYLLKQLIAAGVRVAYYLEDRERTLDSPTDKILLAVSGFADEVERDKARQRTYDAMRRKAGAGHVTCPGHKPPRPDLCDLPARSAGVWACVGIWRDCESGSPRTASAMPRSSTGHAPRAAVLGDNDASVGRVTDRDQAARW